MPSLHLRLAQDDSDENFDVVAASAPQASAMYRQDELFLPESVTTYRKPVAAIHALPERRDVNLKLIQRRLMEALPLAVQLDMRSRGRVAADELVRKIREDRAAPLFEIRTKELGRLAGISTANMERIHSSLAELVGLKFNWNVLGEDGSIEYETCASLLIRRDRGRGARQGYTRFAFEPEVLMWFLEPKMWANLSWTVMSGLGPSDGPGHEAAFGLYQNIWRYLGTSAKMTPMLDVATWIDLILGPSRFVKVDAKGEKTVVGYKDFKRRHLTPGLNILNGLHALNHTVHVTEVRSGRRIARLRFHFTPKQQAAFELPLGWPQPTINKLQEVGYSENDIATLSQVFPFDQVAEALKRLGPAEARYAQKGEKVWSRLALFKGILANVAKGEKMTEEEEVRIQAAAVEQGRKDAEARRMDKLKRQFSKHRNDMIAEALQKLSASERETLIQAHLSAKPGDRMMYRPGQEVQGGGYTVAFSQWLLEARKDLAEQWLPEAKDNDFASWMAWQLSRALDEDDIG